MVCFRLVGACALRATEAQSVTSVVTQASTDTAVCPSVAARARVFVTMSPESVITTAQQGKLETFVRIVILL